MSSSMIDQSQLQDALSHLRAASPPAPTQYEAALLATITMLAQQLALAQEQMQHQKQMIEQLQLLVRQPAPLRRSNARDTPPRPSPPKTIRSMEYWSAHAPEYDEALTPEEIATFLAKPRVRPEDIPIAPVDEKQPQRYSPSPWNLQVLLLVIAGILVLILALGMLLRPHF